MLVLLVCLAVSGCAHPQAKTVATAAEVPLDVPAPPPRAVEPINADALPPVGPVNEPARNAAPRPTRPSPAVQTSPRADAPRVEQPRADVPAGDAVKSDETASKPAPAPAPTLQTTPQQHEGEVEARIHAALARAAGDLNRVDYAKLNNSMRSQYDFAKRYISQSEEAIRARNFVYAQALADKAADLAAQLAGR